MKALIIGYGSMGRRRIRLLKKIYEDCEILCVDNNPERQKQILADGYRCISNLSEAITENPEIAFVCTSPGKHAVIINELIDNKINVFTELNLVSDSYEEIIKKANENNIVVFMSSTMLYNKQIIAIDDELKKTNKPVTYIYHVGQYLPDWHPWESYKDFFIGKKETNGVREIYAIQLPWIINTFGEIEKINTSAQKCTDLEIDFQDSIVASFIHRNGNIGVFVADTVSRKASVSLEVIGEDVHLFWGGKPDSLKKYDFERKELVNIETYKTTTHKEGYADNIIEDQYLDEIKDFIGAVKRESIPKYSLEKDKYTLSIIDKIEGKE